jgi:hypothetical protein
MIRRLATQFPEKLLYRIFRLLNPHLSRDLIESMGQLTAMSGTVRNQNPDLKLFTVSLFETALDFLFHTDARVFNYRIFRNMVKDRTGLTVGEDIDKKSGNDEIHRTGHDSEKNRFPSEAIRTSQSAPISNTRSGDMVEKHYWALLLLFVSGKLNAKKDKGRMFENLLKLTRRHYPHLLGRLRDTLAGQPGLVTSFSRTLPPESLCRFVTSLAAPKDETGFVKTMVHFAGMAHDPEEFYRDIVIRCCRGESMDGETLARYIGYRTENHLPTGAAGIETNLRTGFPENRDTPSSGDDPDIALGPVPSTRVWDFRAAVSSECACRDLLLLFIAGRIQERGDNDVLFDTLLTSVEKDYPHLMEPLMIALKTRPGLAESMGKVLSPRAMTRLITLVYVMKTGGHQAGFIRSFEKFAVLVPDRTSFYTDTLKRLCQDKPMEFPVTARSGASLLESGEETRSEERRVGKECRRLCRSRWSPYH